MQSDPTAQSPSPATDAGQTSLPAQYQPQQIESVRYREWLATRQFHVEPDSHRKPYCIVMPPPNVTGILHMGHALNNTIQDLLVRWRRMQGYGALWVPGTDHAGIATQNVVERRLRAEGKDPKAMPREELLKAIWEWKEHHGNTIVEQLKRLGASCDWERLHFTMDASCSLAVRTAFVELYRRGLIYRGDYIVNWCPRCQTALSDEEVVHREQDGRLYVIRYPLEGQSDQWVTVATTRPETMLGDTAVAVHPSDARYRSMVGMRLTLPLRGISIPVVADQAVDKSFGTGAVKVTPAHDRNDFLIGQRHGLVAPIIMDACGVIVPGYEPYSGLDRDVARQRVLEDLQRQGLLEKEVAHRHAVGHCYRCDTVSETILSKQWFVKMEPLAKPAIAAAKQRLVRFHPARWTKVYINWLSGIRDWCISRQIIWGHRIPVWTCRSCQTVTVDAHPDADLRDCPACGRHEAAQDPDVLDTWFSSWLWPLETLGWPDRSAKDLAYFYPTHTLVSAPEIIFFWIARMIMAGLTFVDQVPFRDIYIHGTVRDLSGRKMSKSLGNIIDPLQIIDQYGADALRYNLIATTAQGSDLFIAEEKFQIGRNFANKLWNATRFMLMSADPAVGVVSDLKALSLADRWILSRYSATVESVTGALNRFRLNAAAQSAQTFFWHEFCDWYLELAKPALADPATRPATSAVLYTVMEGMLLLLHPVMPFVTEEIWQRCRATVGGVEKEQEGGLFRAESIVRGPWPKVARRWRHLESEAQMRMLQELIVGLRTVRAELNLPPTLRPSIVVCAPSSRLGELLSECSGAVTQLAGVAQVSVQKGHRPPARSAVTVIGKVQVAMLLEGLVDIADQVRRLEGKLQETDAMWRQTSSRLRDRAFRAKAPNDVVEKMRLRAEELRASRMRLATLVRHLKRE